MANKAQKAAAAAKAARKAAATPSTPEASSAAAPVAAPTIDKSAEVAGAAQSTVFVVSKLPRGIYLQLFSFVDQQVQVMGGGTRTQRLPMRMPEKVRIRPAVLGFGLIPAYPIIDGWSITRDVPADFWRKWVEQNPGLDIVQKGLIAGFDTEAEAMSYARERGDMRTGLEPLAQDKDPRVMTTNNQNVGDVEIDDETPRPKK